MKRVSLLLVGAFVLSPSLAMAAKGSITVKATGLGSDTVCASKWGFYYCNAGSASKKAKKDAVESLVKDATEQCTEKGGKIDPTFEEKAKKSAALCRSTYDAEGQSIECRMEARVKCILGDGKAKGKGDKLDKLIDDPYREAQEAEAAEEAARNEECVDCKGTAR